MRAEFSPGQPRSFLSVLLLAIVLVSSASCDRRATKLAQRDQDIRARLAKMDLAASKQEDLKQGPPALRVWVNSAGIDLDDLALWQDLTNEDLDRLQELGEPDLQPVEKRAVELKNFKLPPEATKQPGELLLEDLFRALKVARQNGKQIAKFKGGQFKGQVLVIVAPQTPFSLLAKVLYNLGQSEYSRFRFAVRTAAGVGSLKSSAPTFCDNSDPGLIKAGLCQRASVVINSDGVAWQLRDDNEKLCKRVALVGKGTAEDVFKDIKLGIDGELDKVAGVKPKEVPSAEKVPSASIDAPTCPLLSRKSGRLDIAGLAVKLFKRPSEQRLCKVAMLGGTTKVPWRELVEVADVLAGLGSPEFMLFIPLEEGCPF
jgi:hypothetical protein